MRHILQVVVVLHLIASVMCVRSRTSDQQALFSESMLTKLRSSNLGRAVLMLSEVHGKQENVNFNKLFDALDDLAASLEARLTEENADYGAEQLQMESDKQFYSNQVEQYTTEVAQHQIDVRSLTQVRTTYETTLNNKREELAETKRQKSVLENQMALNERSFKQQSDELNEAISVIDNALSLLAEARNSAFIETNHEEYRVVADGLHRSLGDLKG
jgi:hypothetical protein